MVRVSITCRDFLTICILKMMLQHHHLPAWNQCIANFANMDIIPCTSLASMETLHLSHLLLWKQCMPLVNGEPFHYSHSVTENQSIQVACHPTKPYIEVVNNEVVHCSRLPLTGKHYMSITCQGWTSTLQSLSDEEQIHWCNLPTGNQYIVITNEMERLWLLIALEMPNFWIHLG